MRPANQTWGDYCASHKSNWHVEYSGLVVERSRSCIGTDRNVLFLVYRLACHFAIFLTVLDVIDMGWWWT